MTTPLDRVLAACRRSQMTGHVRVESDGRNGHVQLRAGAVARAEIGGWSGPGVLATLRGLRAGRFEVVQRLPDAVDEEGDPGDVPLAAVIRQCEERALTCSLLVTAGLDRARLDVRAGAIARVEVNGFYLDDALDQVLEWPHARFHVVAPRLEIDAERDQATPLPPPPTPMPPPISDVTPLRELRFETAATSPFARPTAYARGPLIWWALIVVVITACAAIIALT